MNKREYYRDRKKLIKAFEKGDLTPQEFSKAMAELATHFKPRWSKDISSTGKLLGSKLMEKAKEGN